MNRRILALALAFVSLHLLAWGQEETATKKKKMMKTDEEWAKLLTRPQFMVTRMKATEPAFSGKYVNNHSKGMYHCVCCNSDLFSSKTKFESGTGWPSFWKPVDASAIATEMDYKTEEERVEVLCSTCGAHLGHVFSDGPLPTGLRYCINSLSLRFEKDSNAPATTKKDSAKAKAKAKGKAASKAKDTAESEPKPDASAKKDEAEAKTP